MVLVAIYNSLFLCMEEIYWWNHFGNEWGNIWITLFMINNIHFCENQDINILTFYNIHDNVITSWILNPRFYLLLHVANLVRIQLFSINVPTFPFEPWKFSSFWFKFNIYCLLKNFLDFTSFIYPPSPLPSLKIHNMDEKWMVTNNSLKLNTTKQILFDENYLSLGILPYVTI